MDVFFVNIRRSIPNSVKLTCLSTPVFCNDGNHPLGNEPELKIIFIDNCSTSTPS